jgi:hypothetical protein
VSLNKPLNWQHYLFLGILGLVASGVISLFQRSPGYMDADYYFAGGIQLAEGKGFTEPYLWNYLDNPAGLPHPSHGYWMPLASILAAIGMVLFLQKTWFAGRIVFLLIAGLIPILTASLAFSLSKNRTLAIVSGLLAIFSGFYAAYIPVTDTFGVYMALGGIFFLIAHRKNNWRDLGLGVISGLMHLARADGIVWLLVSFFVVILFPSDITTKPMPLRNAKSILYCIVGYIFIMGAWLARNKIVFGSFLAPGGESLFWLTQYDQIFSFPASAITYSEWLQSGLGEIFKVRFWALNTNLQNTLASQGNVFLLPLILIGGWNLRKDRRVLVATVTWVGYILLMSIIFPFAGARGGFFHACAALQPMWWALAPIGLVSIVGWVGNKRGWSITQATRIFLGGIVGLSILLTGLILAGKLSSSTDGGRIWDSEKILYMKVDQIINDSNPKQNPIVIVANPPGFYLASGKWAIAIPNGDEETTLLVAAQYHATFLVLESNGFPDGFANLYRNPFKFPNYKYLGDVDGVRVFRIEP